MNLVSSALNKMFKAFNKTDIFVKDQSILYEGVSLFDNKLDNDIFTKHVYTSYSKNRLYIFV